MKLFKAIGLSIIFGSIFLNNAFSQTDTEFWFAAPEVNRYHMGGTAEYPSAGYGNLGTPVYLHLTSFDKSANITISMPANAANFNNGNPLIISIPPNTTYRVDLSGYIGDNQGITPLTSMENRLKWTVSDLSNSKPYINKNNKGILIESDNEITAYYEIGVLYNMDLISLKGKNSLGTKFYVPFQTTNNTRAYNYPYRPYSSIDIIATEDDTKIKIYAPKPIWVKGVGSIPIGWHTIWLNKGETSIITPYQYNGYDEISGFYNTSSRKEDRLAGAVVEVDQTEGSGAPITVITHDDAVQSNYSTNPDYVVDQLVPVNLVGTDYAVIQGIGYNAAEIEDWVYIVGTQDATNVSVKKGPAGISSNYLIGVGETSAISLNNVDYKVATIKSDKPVYVYHMSGAGRQKAGAIIPTISSCTGSTRVAFNRTKAAPYSLQLNLLVWQTGIGRFRLLKNNQNVLNSAELSVLNAINNVANYSNLPETGAPYDNWRYARINADGLDAGVAYLLVNEENVFHLGVLNGNTNNDAFYGYFSNFNQISASATIEGGANPLINVCYGESTQLYATGGAKYSWSPITFLDDPNSPYPNVISPTSTTKYTVTVQGACNLTSTADVTVNVSAPLNPSFIADTITGCGNLNVNFTNTSEGNVQRLYWYVKNEGDPDPGTLMKTANLVVNPTDQGFTYNFANSGAAPQNFVVNLLVDAGICRKVVKKSITVYPHIDINPVVFSTSDANGCHPLTVNFRANPIGNYGTATFNWDFGDGGTSTNPDPSHTYTNFTNTVATFAPYLTITDQYNYCKVTKPATAITVQPYIKANFAIDKVEGCSPFSVQVVNNSLGGISFYQWDKNGDNVWDDNSPANWIFTRTNSSATPDTVTLRLRVQNLSGCYDTFTRDIVIKPQPTADVSVIPTDNLNCSPLTVILQSSVMGGINHRWVLDENEISNNLGTLIQVENNTEIVQQHNITFVTQNQYGCEYISAPRYFIVQPFIKANFAIDKVEGCSPFVANITNNSRGPISHSLWDKDGDGYFESTGESTEWTYILENNNSTSKITNLGLQVYNTGGCSSIASRIITVNSVPKIDLGYDRVICKGEHTILDAGNSCSFFEWSTGETTQTIKVTKTGTYSVTVTNSNDCSATDDINVLVIDNTTITSQPTSLVRCVGDNATFSVDANGTNIKYQWKKDGETLPSETSSTLIIDNVDKSNEGLYHCTVTGDCGSIDSDIVNLIIIEQPKISSQPTQKSVELGKSVSLDVDASGDNLLFKWKKNGILLTEGIDIQGTSTNTIIVSNAKLSDAGNYTCEISNNCSTIISDIITLDVIDIPLVNLGEDKNICQDETITLDAGNDGTTYLWNNGETTRTINVSATGTYSVIVRNIYGYEGSDEINITVHPKPNVNLGDDVQYSSTPLVLDPGPNFSSYQWQDGSTNRRFTVNESGSYSVTVTDINGCSGSDDVYVIWEQLQDIVVSRLLSPVTGCTNDQRQQVVVELQNISKNTYLTGDSIFVYYSLNSKMPIIEGVLFDSDFTPNKTMLYSFTKEEDFENGLSQITVKTILHGEHSLQNTYYVNISPSPYLNFESDTIHSSLPYELVATTSNVSYLWSNGSTNSKITVNSFGEYWLQVTNSYGCTASDTVIILWPVSTEIISGIDATIKLFPNPVKDKLNILIESGKAYSYTIEVMSPQGILVRKLKTLHASNISNTINVEDLTPGMYLIKVSTEKGSAVFKIIVTRN